MINYKAPVVPLLFNPIGIDLAIQKIQIDLRANIGWLGDNAYGRAFKQESKTLVSGEASRRLVYYPEVYQNGAQPLIAMPNDNLKAMSFFYVRDPGRPHEYAPGDTNFYIYPVSIVVWGNLDIIDAGTGIVTPGTPRITEYLKNDILTRFRKNYDIAVAAIFESYENVYSNYTITEEYRQYMKPPYTAFRIDFDLSFKETVPGCDADGNAT